MKHYFGLALLLLNFGACAQSDDLHEEVKSLYENTVPVVKPQELETWNAPELLDSREAEEFSVSHLSGAKLVGYDDFDLERVKHIDKEDTVVIYCSVGYRSERVGEKLLDAGFKHVYNLYGGIFEWKNTGRSVVTPQGDTTERVHAYNKRWSRFLKKGEKVY